MLLNFCRPRRGRPRTPRRPDALPVPWAVEVETLKEARDLIARLEARGVPRVGVAVTWDSKLYVRWLD
jgi:hypothetical protein